MTNQQQMRVIFLHILSARVAEVNFLGGNGSIGFFGWMVVNDGSIGARRGDGREAEALEVRLLPAHTHTHCIYSNYLQGVP